MARHDDIYTEMTAIDAYQNDVCDQLVADMPSHTCATASRSAQIGAAKSRRLNHHDLKQTSLPSFLANKAVKKPPPLRL